MKRRFLLLAAHVVIFGLAYALAFQLRFDSQLPQEMHVLFWQTLPWVLALKLVLFHRLGTIYGWWRHVTFADLAALLKASVLALLIIASVDYFFLLNDQIPRSVLALDCGATILLVGGFRSAWRLVREHIRPALAQDPCRRALMIGVGHGAESLIQQIHASPRLNYRIAGFLDSDPKRHGTWLGGIPILGGPEHGAQISRHWGASDILVIAHTIPGKLLRELFQQCHHARIEVKMLPPVEALFDGTYRLQVRDVNIHDLLRREPVELDCEAIQSLLKGRRVMVTGAGGSIGSEICRQVLRCQPERLLLVERAENSLYHIDQELRATEHTSAVVPCLADVRDEKRMHAIFHRHQPQIVFHAAAHKHVPLMEANPGEAIKNNLLGTKALADMANRHAVEHFVMISTDKAVNPTSIMGASKLLAERYVHAFAERSATKFVVVRFGNVLASNGSVVPLFQEQIRRGGPLTVTHPEMQRYFMTIPEASQLVLQAAAMGQGGEIFVLDMGDPVKIVDLAQDLIRLSGLSPDDIEIVFVGPRPGEKLREEIYLEDERTIPTPHPKLRVARHRPYRFAQVKRMIEELSPLVHESEEVIHEKLRELAGLHSPPAMPRVAPSASGTAPTPRPAEVAVPASVGYPVSTPIQQLAH